MASQKWIPLESNPQVLNKYVHNLGMDAGWNFVDVYGLDPDLLCMVPRPCAAVVLLFPDNTEQINSQDIGDLASDFPSTLYYTKQTIGNACGTVAIVHALANNQDVIPFDASKHFKEFLEKTNLLNPEEKAKFLEEDKLMGSAHGDCASEGDTQAPGQNDKVNSHFIAFVNHNGSLYELDGRKAAPIVHSKTSQETFLEDTAEVVKKFMARDPEDMGFNVMALVQGGDDM